MKPSDPRTRRSLLTASGLALTTLAGCLSGSDDDSEGTNGATTESPTATDTATETAGDGAGTANAGTATDNGSLGPPVAGDPDADVTVAMYEDFACPHCRTFNEEEFPQLEPEYIEPGSIRYEHHDFPIPVDQTVSWQAPSAARAVQATVGDDAFYEYTKLLFANQGSLGPDTYASLAGEVDADGSTVRTAAEERRYDEVVEADRQQGIDAGARGTPAAFVNGQQVDATYEAISSAIDEA